MLRSGSKVKSDFDVEAQRGSLDSTADKEGFEDTAADSGWAAKYIPGWSKVSKLLPPPTEARKKWVSLIRTYFQMGGSQIQPTVASAEMLRAAQKEPEKYKDLIVKIGGYSTYFTELGREIQAEIIDRTEHR